MGQENKEETDFQKYIRLFRQQSKFVRFQDFCDWYDKQKEKKEKVDE